MTNGSYESPLEMHAKYERLRSEADDLIGKNIRQEDEIEDLKRQLNARQPRIIEAPELQAALVAQRKLTTHWRDRCRDVERSRDMWRKRATKAGRRGK
jgi:hypothetical protein